MSKQVHFCLGNEGDEDFDTAVRTAREKESISMLDVSCYITLFKTFKKCYGSWNVSGKKDMILIFSDFF